MAARTRKRMRRVAERGVAVITALLVVALATLAVTGVLWRQQVQARSVEGQLALAETRWLARGAIDWARTMLTYDATRSGALDHLGEFWAVPIAETQVSSAEDGGLRDGYLSGQISDEQSRYNLLNLATGGVVDEAVELPRFARLLEALGLDPGLAPPIAQAVANAQAATDSEGKTLAAATLPMLVVDDLLRVSGVDANAVAALRPFVSLLPRVGNDKTLVNVNTAGPEVLYAMVPGLTIQQAQVLARQHDNGNYFASTAYVGSALRTLGAASADVSALSVETHYFRVEGRIRYDRALVNLAALIYRADLAGNTRVLWQEEN